MKKQTIILSLILLGGGLGAQEPPSTEPPGAEAPVHEIRMTAKKYEYDPGEIHVKQGERVRLILKALDRKHGFQIKEFGIKTVLKKGQETVVEFVADKAGTFQFKCSKWCGFGHGRMRGRLVVEPAENEEEGQESKGKSKN